MRTKVNLTCFCPNQTNMWDTWRFFQGLLLTHLLQAVPLQWPAFSFLTFNSQADLHANVCSLTQAEPLAPFSMLLLVFGSLLLLTHWWLQVCISLFIAYFLLNKNWRYQSKTSSTSFSLWFPQKCHRNYMHWQGRVTYGSWIYGIKNICSST